MTGISEEVRQEWIKLGLLNEDGEFINPLDQLKNGSSVFFINRIDEPYSIYSQNRDAIELDYAEYCDFRKFLNKVINIDLDQIFKKKMFYTLPENIANKIGFGFCNIEGPNSNTYSSPEKQKECHTQKARLLEQIHAFLNQ